MTQKIIFLDRDGVIINNSKHYYIYRTEDVEFVSGIFEKLAEFAYLGYKFIIISNQSGIAKGKYTIDDVNRVHNYLKNEFAAHNLLLLDAYFCPHHPSISSCLCRKPDSLLLEKALAQHQVDIKRSFLIGDSESDILSAKKIGMLAFKIKANTDLRDYPFFYNYEL